MSTNEQDPAAVLAKYSLTKLQCRVDRHRWGRKAFYQQQRTPGFSRRYQTCQDCGSQRWKEINIRTFEYTGRYGYIYAQGYQTPGTGLRLVDFAERLYEEDYTSAVNSGRIIESKFDDDEVEVEAPALKAVPQSKKKAS